MKPPDAVLILRGRSTDLRLRGSILNWKDLRLVGSWTFLSLRGGLGMLGSPNWTGLILRSTDLLLRGSRI